MDKEPNNTIDKAVQLEMDTVPFSTTIQEKGDIDWFKIDIPEAGYYIITTTSVPEGLKMQIQFAAFQEFEGKKEKYLTDWLEFPAVFHAPKAGTYYLKIHDDFEDASSKDPVVFKAKFLKEFDQHEMNDDYKSAKTLTLDETTQFYIYPNSDFDWFKIDLKDQKGYLRAMTKESYEGVNPQIKFYTFNEWSDNKLVTYHDWTEFPCAIPLPKENVLYFVIHDDFEDASTTQAYTLKLKFVPEMDKNEPNNKYENATEIFRNDTLNVAIFPKDDFDYFKITINEGDSLSFMAKGFDDALNPQIKLYTLNENGNGLESYADWENFPHSYKVNAGTTYYICLHDDFEDVGSEQIFQIFVK